MRDEFSHNWLVKFFLARETVMPNNTLSRLVLYDDLPFKGELQIFTPSQREVLLAELGEKSFTPRSAPSSP